MLLRTTANMMYLGIVGTAFFLFIIGYKPSGSITEESSDEDSGLLTCAEAAIGAGGEH